MAVVCPYESNGAVAFMESFAKEENTTSTTKEALSASKSEWGPWEYLTEDAGCGEERAASFRSMIRGDGETL